MKECSTFWVTGGAGFIGSHLVRMLVKKYSSGRVVTIDKLTYAGNLKNLSDVPTRKNHFFFKGDIADKNFIARIAKKHPPEYVINCAAETHVDESIHGNANVFARTNIEGVRVLLEVLRQGSGLKKIVQASTDEVYGDLPRESKEKFTEHSLLRPNSPYAATKAAGDLLALAYYRTYGIPAVVTRCGNNFGPSQYPEKIIPYFVSRALEGEPLPLYGDGKHVRDWIFVEDHCDALVHCMMRGKPGEIYNIGAGNEKENRAIAEIILTTLGCSAEEIQFVQDRPGHDRRYALNTDKIKKELGWKPRFAFEPALQKTIKWYKNNPEWIVSAKRRKSSINAHINFF